MPRNTVVLEIKIDVGPFKRAMQKLQETMLLAQDAMANLLRTVVEISQDKCGAGNRTGDGLWQSDMCAAWVHESCQMYDSCDCRCHA